MGTMYLRMTIIEKVLRTKNNISMYFLKRTKYQFIGLAFYIIYILYKMLAGEITTVTYFVYR